ncbi:MULTISPECIES: metalloregulator ArsR/SmtB family transcription factor [Mesorhizobium]|uniref:ArsR/SmtB family transcription factor n=1 Tax=Mesorhizobium TaxID=68287 RepID=UPI0003CF929A|nr:MULTISPECIES: metalloregulator ArsR/SmtB family transcription factor [Mesorhizobium]ESY68648.1 hypothetical protein X742_11165 [Mesorhizobium sp. LNHC232B00]WJI42003.1 metalloregulator ArsR/SmtB family transcription factor [Mesorhizobium opportunistum]
MEANSPNLDRLSDHAAPAAELLAVLGNERRLVILGHLTEGEISVGELAVLVGLSKSALSQHLSKLRKHQLVSTRRHRQTVYYSCGFGISQKITQIFDVAVNLAAVSQAEKPRKSPAA